MCVIVVAYRLLLCEKRTETTKQGGKEKLNFCALFQNADFFLPNLEHVSRSEFYVYFRAKMAFSIKLTHISVQEASVVHLFDLKHLFSC